MRRSPLALVLYALVLLGIVGTTAAFSRLDKTVTLTVDGHSTQVRTFARDVEGLLHRKDITVGDHDLVAPGLEADLVDGAKVVLRHGRQLALTVDGQHRVVWTTALTVEEALTQLGVRGDGAFLSASRSERLPREGFALELRSRKAVTLLYDGRARQLSTTAASVRGVLAEAKVRVARTDRVTVGLDRRPVAGMKIRVVRVRSPRVTETVAIDYATKRVANASLYRGDTRVLKPGVTGARVLTYQLTVVDGRTTARRLIASRVTRQAQTKVMHYGTKSRPGHGPDVGGRADELNWDALARCESGGNPRAVSSNGRYYGLYQFSLGTWRGVGGHGKPTDYGRGEQTYRAKLLWQRSGAGPWPVCGRYLYS